MTTSISKSVASRLSEIQLKLKAPKGQFSEYGNYSYRSCEDILEAVKPLLNGMALIIEDTIVNIGDRFYVKATVYLTDGAEGVSTSAFAREALSKTKMDDSQVTGASSSYARKYALNGLFAIDDTKDADTMDNTKKAPVSMNSYDEKLQTQDACPHTNQEVRESSGAKNPENKGRKYMFCNDCGKFIKWIVQEAK